MPNLTWRPCWLTGRMHITRAGLTSLKGACHASREYIHLDRSGPRDDRLWCLLDADRDRVLRTVEHPAMVLVHATWDGTALTVRTPEGGEVRAAPEPTGQTVVSDYWGRDAELEIMRSDHSDLLADHLGRGVRLARSTRTGEVVYGGAVTLITTGALADLGETQDARFRSTFTIDAEHDPEPGSELRLGEAVVRIRGPVPRCRVVDVNPDTGLMDTTHLSTLATRPRPSGEIPFGVDADVLVPGTVRLGDAVQELSSGQPASVVPS